MAGAGYKLFNTGDVLTAAQVNTYLQEQTVMVFASSTARTTALSGVLAEGMMSYLQDTNAVEVYNGTSWTAVGGGGLSSPLTTKGDVWGYSTTNARIPVGTNGQVLTADSAQSLGLKWASPSSGSLIKLAAGSLSGTTISFNNIFTDAYTNYLINWNVTDTDGIQRLRFRVGGSDDTTTSYFYVSYQSGFSGTPTWGLLNNGSSVDAALEMPTGSAGNRYTWSVQLRTRPVSSTLNDLPKYFGTWNRGSLQSGVLYGGFSSGTDFDGFTVYNSGSTWSGTYEVYGYAK